MKITTRYLSATDTKGARFRATGTLNGKRKTLTVPYDYARDAAANHALAASRLAARFAAYTLGATGQTKDGRGYTFTAGTVKSRALEFLIEAEKSAGFDSGEAIELIESFITTTSE